MAEDVLTEEQRAEDIILGGLGFGEEAHILSLEVTEDGFRGVGAWSDGEEFSFENDEPISSLEDWALTILLQTLQMRAAAG